MATILIAMLAFATVQTQSVKADVYVESGFACKSGSGIYFAFTSKNKSTPIYKFDIKTGKRSKVFPIKKSTLTDFKNLNVLNGNIYCSASQKNVLNDTNIYKINIKTGKAKWLARGIKPTIVNGKIVYESVKTAKVNDGLTFTFVPSGKKCAIDTDGSKKKNVDHESVSVEETCSSKKIASGKYTFYISKDNKKLYRKTAGAKKAKSIFKTKKITGFRVLGSYLVVKTSKGGSNQAYCIKASGKTINGKKSVKILTW